MQRLADASHVQLGHGGMADSQTFLRDLEVAMRYSTAVRPMWASNVPFLSTADVPTVPMKAFATTVSVRVAPSATTARVVLLMMALAW